ncbi:TIGR04222 domain-containing membrane protein [Streptomyces sp. NPDC048340]|uniref:TIGR04222 domain-containing membrane protein n=1 Tax=Streptomyces sp. NPDC048340 TaxID=3365537 RepID=UPI003714DBFD
MFWVLFLLLAWAGVLIACTRLLRAATEAAEPVSVGAITHHHDELNLYEAAYLSGGPRRVAELTLPSMQRQRRLLLAHTGWATVLDPVGRDPHERSALVAFGPDGQSPVASIRTAVAEDAAVRALAERLGAAGLAPAGGAGRGTYDAIRSVRRAALLVLAMAAAAFCVPADGTSAAMLLSWFALPLLLALGCLAIARFEGHRDSPWASPDGQRLLDSLDRERGREGSLTAVAVRGLGAVADPGLRAALEYGGRGSVPRQRGD